MKGKLRVTRLVDHLVGVPLAITNVGELLEAKIAAYAPHRSRDIHSRYE
jgi:hypothetical protein